MDNYCIFTRNFIAGEKRGKRDFLRVHAHIEQVTIVVKKDGWHSIPVSELVAQKCPKKELLMNLPLKPMTMSSSKFEP